MGVMLETVMFGGARAGKTTLLTQMMSVVRTELESAGLDLRVTQRTVEFFAKARDDLAELVDSVHRGESGLGHGIASTDPGAPIRRYVVGIDNSDGVTAALLAFHDYSGEYLQALTTERAADVRGAFSKARALLVAVNTPTLMASLNSEDSVWNDLHINSNWPDVLNNVLTDYPTPDLVIFCPIKCERWIREDPSGVKLRDAVQQGYRKPLNTLKKKNHAKQCLFIPVVTCGSIEFDGFGRSGSTEAPPTLRNVYEKFRPVSNGGKLSPMYNDQPLRHLMTHVLERVDYKALSEAYAEDTPNTVWDFVMTAGKLITNVIADEWTSVPWLPRFEGIKEVVDTFGGRREYQLAAETIAKRASVRPPIYRL